MTLPMLVVSAVLIFLAGVWFQERVLWPRKHAATAACEEAAEAVKAWRRQYPQRVVACHPEAQELVDRYLQALRTRNMVWRLPTDHAYEQRLLRLRNNLLLPGYPDTGVAHTP